ncbi:MAG TPA: SRPBCC family protein [Marmoricola sp.]|nr:SRPBCC family protein [Marmoricola sp.]
MHFEDSIEVSAPASAVFDAYVDVVHWPSWTSSVTSVELLDPGPFRRGMRARVRQPRLPVAVWQVTELVPGRSFTWVARSRGLVTTGTHVVVPLGEGSCTATAMLDQDGLLGPVVGLSIRGLTNRYLRTELEGLRAYCES